jgi:putative long chain acyl-CoA synthase
MYASTEAHIVLANARGRKLGSVGRPLPGSPDVAIAAWALADDDFVRDGAGRLIHARLDEPGMLIAALGAPSSTAGADLAHIDPRRIVGDAFAPGDRWFVTGDLFRVDAEGDHWFVDHRHHRIATHHGPVASTRIEDALYEVPGVALCAVVGRPDPVAGPAAAPDLAGGPAAPAQFPVAAIQLHPGAPLDVDALSRAVATLPEYARPRRIRRVDALPMTDGYRPIKQALAGLDLSDGPEVLAWDPRAQRYQPTVEPAARSA